MTGTAVAATNILFLEENHTRPPNALSGKGLRQGPRQNEPPRGERDWNRPLTSLEDSLSARLGQGAPSRGSSSPRMPGRDGHGAHGLAGRRTRTAPRAGPAAPRPFAPAPPPRRRLPAPRPADRRPGAAARPVAGRSAIPAPALP